MAENLGDPNCWIPRGKGGKGISNKGMSYITLFVAIGLLGGILLGYGIRGIVLTPSFNPTIDGIIESNEYKGGNWRIGDYFDVNNTGGNVDAFNYFYVGQTTSSVYIAVDLVSDTTNNTNGEWFSIWLNTFNRTFGGWNDSWYSFRNNGTENFVYDVEHTEIKPYATGHLEDYDLWWSNTSAFDVDLTFGTWWGGGYTWDNTQDFDWTWWGARSQNGGSGATFYDKVVVNFSFDIANYFGMLPEFKTELLDSIANAKIIAYTWLTDIPSGKIDSSDFGINGYTKVHVDDNGTFNDAPLYMDKTNFTSDYNCINLNKSAFADGKLDLSIEVYNESAWYLTEQIRFFIDSFRIMFDISESDALYGTSTITNNYTLAIGFGASPNSEVPHRMYEFRVSKIILENYTNDGNLGIYIQGAGLTFESNNVYWFGAGNQHLYFIIFLIWDESNPDWSVNYYYIRMNRKGE